jgi:hypothetical protein
VTVAQPVIFPIIWRGVFPSYLAYSSAIMEALSRLPESVRKLALDRFAPATPRTAPTAPRYCNRGRNEWNPEVNAFCLGLSPSITN